ncbi:MAG: division/cell wall cluster transcriptional repressor MraZ [Desulfovibrionaceae bacterium]|nr:division/cell wall cluster transcriptional repressor MraZ [Desulfovibrionaceae bacterium]
MYFRGRSSRSLDPKGRLMLPPEFRESLAARGRASAESGMDQAAAPALPASPEASVAGDLRFVITTYDDCLAAYPWADWVELEHKFARLRTPSPKVRAFRRLLIGGAEVQTLDAQGRVRLSQDHRDYAGLGKDVVILGLINRFELWNPERLRANMDSQRLDDVSEELAASGIDFAL